MPTPPATTIADAYARGFSEGTSAPNTLMRWDTDAFAPLNLNLYELREAVNSWTSAATMHEHTSYYGAFHIRAMRAYWLGRMRAARAREARLEELARHSAIASALARPIHATG